MSEPLLPSSVNSYVPAANARLARTQDLRNLFSAAQVAKLFGHDSGLNWLSETISQDRTPELRQYLMRELEVAEITPETILSKLNKSFFEEQSDDWIIRLYAFLTELPGLSYRFAFLPLIRLEDGTHVSDAIIGQQSAFLPSDKETGFRLCPHARAQADPIQTFGYTVALRSVSSQRARIQECHRASSAAHASARGNDRPHIEPRCSNQAVAPFRPSDPRLPFVPNRPSSAPLPQSLRSGPLRLSPASPQDVSKIVSKPALLCIVYSLVAQPRRLVS